MQKANWCFQVLRSEAVGVEFLEHFYSTCALLLLECNSDENIRMQLNLIIDIQVLLIVIDHGNILFAGPGVEP